MSKEPNAIEEKLERLDREPSIDLRRVAVLICPPVSLWRCCCAAYLPMRILRPLSLASDYIRGPIDETGASFWRYWKTIGRPAGKLLRLIENTPARLVRNAGWRDLMAAIRDRSQVIFLLAHHPDRTDSVEFSGEWREWEQTAARLGELREGVCVLTLCHSVPWRDQLRARYPQVLAPGGPFEMNFAQSIRFIAFFLGSCDGKRTFSQAFARSETRYFEFRGTAK
ncbi:MAG TPA: hypothetical protein VMB03_23830 [Bryobacteraceae bacterium]|nr:hypothetical protein [Bryobacteraceae bacterium]